MSSGFVSAGTNEEPIERDDEWRKAQEAIEANFRRKQEEGKQDGGKTLYDVLQQNKAAKQEAFEESIRLKNQFRTLDEDEVEFLDSVLESTRAKEAAVKKETAEQLEAFRQQREAAEKALLDAADNPQTSSTVAASPADQSSWIISGKKRRHRKEKEIFVGTKLRKMSSSAEKGRSEIPHAGAALEKQINSGNTYDETAKASNRDAEKLSEEHASTAPQSSPKTATTSNTVPKTTSALGLGSYSSDED